MKNKKTICIITGTRADWGLFYPLAREIKNRQDSFDIRLIATGAHFSEFHGQTWREIEEDGFHVDKKVEILALGDTEDSNILSVSSCISGMLKALREIKPDMVCLLGDRYETFAAAVTAFMLKIPIAHIHGGEVTEGAIDDAFRHSITKMSNIHFVSTDVYAKRVIQLGENPNKVFCVGALGIDNIKQTKLLSKEEVESRLGVSLGDRNVLVTYHPVTMEGRNSSDAGLQVLLSILDNLKEMKIIFTRPNADMYSGDINERIDAFVKENSHRAIAVKSLGRILYLSTARLMDVVAGNSSSGIIEVSAFGVPVVNIGDRQKGRVRPIPVIDVPANTGAMHEAFKKALSREFIEVCKSAENPYGEGKTAVKIADILEDSDLSDIKKSFYDVNFTN